MDWMKNKKQKQKVAKIMLTNNYRPMLCKDICHVYRIYLLCYVNYESFLKLMTRDVRTVLFKICSELVDIQLFWVTFFFWSQQFLKLIFNFLVLLTPFSLVCWMPFNYILQNCRTYGDKKRLSGQKTITIFVKKLRKSYEVSV